MTGLIAYFDILGYQSFLDKNPDSTSETVKKVLELITNIPQKIKDDISKAFIEIEEGDKDAEIVSNSIVPLIFSDTILLSIQYPKNVSVMWKAKALFLLSAMSNYLCGKMFVEGLPLRGVIVEGDFTILKNCLAGEAIVRAYKICQTLDLSGVVIPQNVLDGFSDFINQTGAYSFILSYLTPKNKGLKEEPMYHTNWLHFYTSDQQKNISEDIERFVLRSFWAHNKDCSQEVDSKVSNTSKLLRRFVIALENIKENKLPAS
jgi:hypothetical protein